jgi:hypothetical protein
MTRQWLRKASLLVGSDTEQQDLSALRFTFQVKMGDVQSPNQATFRVYNVSDATAQRVQKEFTKLVFQAGYESGPFGIIFQGTVVQVRRGRESGVDTFLDITAADGDEAHNFATVNTALSAGHSFRDRIDALAKAMGVEVGHVPDLPPQKFPRGYTMCGMPRDFMRDLALSTDTKWSIQNGTLQLIPLYGYLPDEAVVLTSNTGMIGLPTQTIDGIHVRCLLNPQIKVGGRVRINNASVQQAPLDISYQGSKNNAVLPSIKDDGFYRVVVNAALGDTRGNDWYSDLTCIALGEATTPSLVARGYV